MTDFIQQQGPAFLAHLLRRLADDLVQGAAEWYPTVGVEAPPRTISTLLALDEHGPLAVTELSGLLRQSHPLVIVWIKELGRLSLVTSHTDPADRRRTLVRVTAKGRDELARIRAALVVMERASSELLASAGPDSLRMLWALERNGRSLPFLQRLQRNADDGSPQAAPGDEPTV
ncbi:MarR family winged helix-turn-helix transcriptional regulator [Luteimonas abyssi]|uniref:MarR family winged helix-turn-helix transcriptional regulator n=1 Tax=Luteimonas abyssi TaxID=1247514 RepID=UPI000737D349|nr:MarR family winged helix-turn-helix transcriptional regulator [Luteimonas abyssi]